MRSRTARSIGARQICGLLLALGIVLVYRTSGVLNFSQVFVGPFEGILRTDALSHGGSVLDIAAIVALIGWTILEAIP